MEAYLKKSITLLLVCLLLMAGACKKAAQGPTEEQAIKQALEKYLTTQKHINLQVLKVEYKNFQIAPDNATVEVMFKSGSSDEMSIGFKYSLKKTANGWEVEKSEATSGSMFGGHAPGAPPAGSPMTGEAPQLPSGHPNLTQPSGSGTPASPPPGPMEPAHGKETPKK